MSLDRNPVHRRLIVPWYDSNAACWLMFLGLAPVLLFSLLGLSLARSSAEGPHCIGVPLCLTVLSGAVMGVNLVRLLRRVIQRIAR